MADDLISEETPVNPPEKTEFEVQEAAIAEMRESHSNREDKPSGEEEKKEIPVDGEDDPAREDGVTDEAAGTEAKEEIPEAPVFDDELVSRAEKFLGWSKDQLSAIGNPQLVEQAIYSALSRQVTPPEDAPPEEPPVQETPPEAKKPTKEDVDFYEILKAEGYSEDVISALQQRDVVMREQLQKQYDSKFGVFEAQVKAISDHLLGQERAQWERSMDTELAAMAQYESVVGKGSGYDMDPKSAELQNRVKVLDLAETMRNKYIAAGEKAPSNAQLAKMALNGLFSEQLQSIARKEVAGKVQKRDRMRIARPSNMRSGEGTALTTDEEGIRAIVAARRERGQHDDYGQRTG